MKKSYEPEFDPEMDTFETEVFKVENPFLSRKFILSLIILGMLFGLTVAGKLEVGKFVEWVSVIYGTFAVANVAEKFKR